MDGHGPPPPPAVRRATGKGAAPVAACHRPPAGPSTASDQQRILHAGSGIGCGLCSGCGRAAAQQGPGAAVRWHPRVRARHVQHAKHRPAHAADLARWTESSAVAARNAAALRPSSSAACCTLIIKWRTHWPVPSCAAAGGSMPTVSAATRHAVGCGAHAVCSAAPVWASVPCAASTSGPAFLSRVADRRAKRRGGQCQVGHGLLQLGPGQQAARGS
jgi:hypothetical protein